MGNHSLKNGVSKFKYFIDGSAFNVEYIPLDGEEVEFNYEYYDKETDNTYNCNFYQTVIYPENLVSYTFFVSESYISGRVGEEINFKGSLVVMEEVYLQDLLQLN